MQIVIKTQEWATIFQSSLLLKRGCYLSKRSKSCLIPCTEKYSEVYFDDFIHRVGSRLRNYFPERH